MTAKCVLFVISVVVLLDWTRGLERCAPGNDCGTNEANTTALNSAANFTTSTPSEATEATIRISTENTTIEVQGVVPLSNSTNKTIDEPRGRALNFTIDEHGHQNVLSSNTSTHDQFGDLSDVSMDNDDDDERYDGKIITSKLLENNKTLGICTKGGLTYENGEKLESGCDSICTCMDGKMDCVDRCKMPLFKKGKKIDDPLCTAKDTDDPCCFSLVCAADTETEPLEMCMYNNKTYNRGDQFQKGCEEVCNCEIAGKISCKPRCPPVKKTSDRCVEVPDLKDPCCKAVLCDVTLDEHEREQEEATKNTTKLISAKYVNISTIQVKFSRNDTNDSLPLVEVSEDKRKWTTYKLLPGGYLGNLEANARYVKIEDTDEVVEIEALSTPSTSDGSTCTYKGQNYKVGQEFNDGCESFCVCRDTGVKCLKLQCPTYFGVDVMDPQCVEWETVPPNFTPVAPNCCPEKLKCKNNGSCYYEGQIFQNWQQIPQNVTGCQKSCYCEMGNVECQNNCPPVPALPPANLHCPPTHAMLSHLPDDDCCMHWTCKPAQLPEGPVRNVSKDDDKEHKHESSETTPLITHSTKPPSKVFGPLVVYANDDKNLAETESSTDSLKPVKKPHIVLDENPFYHKDKLNKNAVKADEVTYDNLGNAATEVPYLGPLNPQTSKPIKTSKPAIAKTKPKPNVFIAPTVENYVPQHNIPVMEPTKPISPSQIPTKPTPEEILHIINQHPQLATYPDGSVLEIHNIPNDNRQKPYINQNSLVPQQPTRQQSVIPYVIPEHSGIPLPPGVSLEQLLQEIHKSEQHAYVPVQYQQNGQVFVVPQSPPVQNSTAYSGDLPGQLFPGGYPNLHDYQPQEEVVVNNLEAVDAHTVRLSFSVPRIYVGLHARVEVRYTHRRDDDISTWELQVFAPPNDLIVSPQLEFDLLDLKPDTEYKIKITVTLRDLHNTPTSRVYTVKTLKDVPSTTLPPIIPIEPNLAISDINATWVNVIWRKFTDYELQFIDGVQLRYKEIDGKIYAATPLIHRAVTSYTLENLKPNTKYEIGIYFIPFPGQATELHASHMLHFTTANEVDTYGFNVTLEITQIKPTSVDISWSGVPYPEDKYVNIYRAIYQSDSGKGDYSKFKIPKRDSPTKTTIVDLKPGTRYRLWLEVYLTNGKIKTSNVQDFVTKPKTVPSLGASTMQDKLASSEYPDHRGDYYGPLVIVAILAAIAILSTLILLLILVRRHSQNKAAITPPTRVSQSAYDNPTYKVEIQQETMGL